MHVPKTKINGSKYEKITKTSFNLTSPNCFKIEVIITKNPYSGKIEIKIFQRDSLYSQKAWVKLFKMAKKKIEIVSYHWGLRKGSGKGEQVYEALASGIDFHIIGAYF